MSLTFYVFLASRAKDFAIINNVGFNYLQLFVFIQDTKVLEHERTETKTCELQKLNRRSKEVY